MLYNVRMERTKIKEGDVFHYLTVIKRVENANNGHSRWLCKCKCGNETVVMSSHLIGGKIKSCGCWWEERKHEYRKIHGHSHKERLYNIWLGMKNRCYTKSHIRYSDYGGRGITVCAEWKQDYSAFRSWAIQNGYADYLTIDRIDNNGNYEPSNCRWVSMHEQCRNQRTNVMLTYCGKTQTMKDWAKELNMSYSAIGWRIRNGWNVEKALTTPVQSFHDI